MSHTITQSYFNYFFPVSVPALFYVYNLNTFQIIKCLKCTLYCTNHRAVQEANRIARQQCRLYPRQVMLGMSLRVRTQFRLDRQQEGQGEQCCGCPLWATLQPAFVHQRVTERHDLPKKTRDTHGCHGLDTCGCHEDYNQQKTKLVKTNKNQPNKNMKANDFVNLENEIKKKNGGKILRCGVCYGKNNVLHLAWCGINGCVYWDWVTAF